MWISSTIVYIQLRSAQQVNNTFRVYIQIYICILCIMYVCMYYACFGSVVTVTVSVYGKNCVCAYAYCTIPQWLVDWLTGGQGGNGHGRC